MAQPHLGKGPACFRCLRNTLVRIAHCHGDLEERVSSYSPRRIFPA